jgi:hypothetical protein
MGSLVARREAVSPRLSAALAQVAEISTLDLSDGSQFPTAMAALEGLHGALCAQARANVGASEYQRIAGHAATQIVDDPAHLTVAAFGPSGLLIMKIIDDSAEVLARFEPDGGAEPTVEPIAPTAPVPVAPAAVEPALDDERAAMFERHRDLINSSTGLEPPTRPRRRRLPQNGNRHGSGDSA